MKFSAVALIVAVANISFNFFEVEAAGSGSYRGARGSEDHAERRLQMVTPTRAPTKAPTLPPTASPTSAPTSAPVETATTTIAEAKGDGKGESKGESKGKGGGKGDGKGGPMDITRPQALLDFFFQPDKPCPECKELLPGYSFFGDLYFEEDFYFGIFYRDAVLAQRAGQTVTPLGTFGPLSPIGQFLQIFENTCIPDPLPICLQPLTANLPICSVRGAIPPFNLNYFLCKVIAGISEIVYRLDITRCILLSLSQTARELVCLFLDLSGVPNPDIGNPIVNDDFIEQRRQLADKVLHKVNAVRKLNAEKGNNETMTQMDETMLALHFGGVKDVPTLLNLFSITEQTANFTQAVYAAENITSTRRELEPGPVRPTDFDFLGELNFAANAFFNADTVQSLESNLFFTKCVDIFDYDPLFCAVLFAVYKTTDASLCYYQDELGCTIDESCTKEVAFQTEYAKRRTASFIPGILDIGLVDAEFEGTSDPSNFLIADVIAPCSVCLSDKNECTPYCNYVAGFDTCDVQKRLWIYDNPDLFTIGVDAVLAFVGANVLQPKN